MPRGLEERGQVVGKIPRCTPPPTKNTQRLSERLRMPQLHNALRKRTRAPTSTAGTRSDTTPTATPGYAAGNLHSAGYHLNRAGGPGAASHPDAQIARKRCASRSARRRAATKATGETRRTTTTERALVKHAPPAKVARRRVAAKVVSGARGRWHPPMT